MKNNTRKTSNYIIKEEEVAKRILDDKKY